MERKYIYKNLTWKEKGNKWHYGDEFINFLKEELSSGRSINSLRKEVGMDLKVFNNILKKENIQITHNKSSMNFKAIYQDYDWCYQKYMVEGLNHNEMAKEAGCTKRVIEKWCCEKHRITQKFRQQNKQLTQTQRDLIIGSMLGDGHIDNRETQPIFIVSHAENQKDYLFWKYEIIKDFCNIPPTYYPEKTIKHFKSGDYEAQPYYRISSRIHDCFKEIRSMSVVELMSNLNEFSFSIHMLDDGHRSSSNWHTCVAPYTQIEKGYMIKVMKDKFGIDGYILESDDRYINFDSDDSRKIDEIILNNVPNELDIIKCKITENKITKRANYRFVKTDKGLVGLTKFCKNNGISSCKRDKTHQRIESIYNSGITNGEDILNVYYGGI